MNTTVTTPATAKQIAFATKLVNEVLPMRGLDDDRIRACEAFQQAWIGAVENKRGMSTYIDSLIDIKKEWVFQDRKNNSTVADEPEAGMYIGSDGYFIRVYEGRESGRMLAKKLVEEGEGVRFEYMGLASRFLTGARKMSLEEAKEFGMQTGTCCVCARLLTDPSSVEAGIGPVCITKV